MLHRLSGLFMAIFLISGCGSDEKETTTQEAAVKKPAQVEQAAPKKKFIETLDLAAAGCDSVRALRTFKQCKACHSADPGAKHKTGPNLYDVHGRKAGGAEGYRYSPVFKKSDITWDDTTLDAFLANPQQYLKGNRMAYGGVRNDANRQAMVCLLRLLK